LPRKLGQHFLTSDSILERLATAACGEYTPRVVEIGSGRGALTRHLLRRTGELHAIELDGSLIEYLRRKYASETQLHVHRDDVLLIDIAQWGSAVITGNLPYYITSPIIEKFLALDSRFPVGVFVMQSEVADRILAAPHTRAYGYLTVATQLVCDVELVQRVPASGFVPPPKVDSAAIRFLRKREQPAHLTDLLTFVSRCFAHKRKTLRNNLRPFYGERVDALHEAGLRGEQLTLAHFIDLFKRLSEPIS
jgi:16S rRNA (adenine1518-N6/adenine1519-N6)-dimethyltransferase